MDLLLWLQLSALPVTALFVLATPPAVMARRQCWPMVAVGFWASGLLLLGMWVTTTLQAAVRADETAGRGDVFDTAWWLVLAAVAGVVSLGLLGKGGPAEQR